MSFGKVIYDKLLQYSKLENELFETNNTEQNFHRYITFNHNKYVQEKFKSNSKSQEIRDLKRKIKELDDKISELQEKKIIKCGKCGERGHNSRTCKALIM